MNRIGHENINWFIGPEVEHTPAFAKKTLFVIDIQDAAEIEKLAKEHKTPHVFLGANHSFDATNYTEYFGKTWNDLILSLIRKGYWVSLDYPAHQHESVLKMLDAEIWQSRLFVPLLRVCIPKVETSSPNLTIKIDDVGFNLTNAGVWCWNYHEITDSNKFTGWTEYGDDVVLNNVTPKPFNINVDTIPAINIQEEIIPAVTTAMNSQELGLDIESKSSLKADDVEPEVQEAVSQEAVVEAYTKATTSDPLAVVAPAKKIPVKKKKE